MHAMCIETQGKAKNGMAGSLEGLLCLVTHDVDCQSLYTLLVGLARNFEAQLLDSLHFAIV